MCSERESEKQTEKIEIGIYLNFYSLKSNKPDLSIIW